MENTETQKIEIDVIDNNGLEFSFFNKEEFELTGNEQRYLTERINAENFRFRTSNADYESDWHIAGDPTLIIVLDGAIRILLRNGNYKIFGKGDMFVAKDYLKEGMIFNQKLHGHKVSVEGLHPFKAIHVKLDYR